MKWLEMERRRSRKEIEEFKKVLKKVAGVWTEEPGHRYVKKIRKEWERRAERFGI